MREWGRGETGAGKRGGKKWAEDEGQSPGLGEWGVLLFGMCKHTRANENLFFGVRRARGRREKVGSGAGGERRGGQEGREGKRGRSLGMGKSMKMAGAEKALMSRRVGKGRREFVFLFLLF